MRSTLLMFIFVLFAFGPGLSAAQRQNVPPSDGADKGMRAGSADLPTIARNQARPIPRVAPQCSDCDQQPAFEDPAGYVSGACNCGRNCNVNLTGCQLGSNNECKATQGGGCQDCTGATCS
jgi:hypothetical protein